MNKTLIIIAALLGVASAAQAQSGAESQLSTRDSTFGLNLPGNGPQAAELRTYIVQLREPGAAEIHAQTFGSRAAAAGQPLRSSVRFDRNSAAVQSYTRRLEAAQDTVIARVGPGTRKIHSYRYSLNGFSARMTPLQAAKMESMPEVLAVWEDEVRPLTTNFSRDFLDLFNNERGLRGPLELDGEDVVIAFIDSGIVPNHPSLGDSRQSGPRACRSTWADVSFLGQWLCRQYKNAEETLLYEPPENWNGACETGDGWTEGRLQQQADRCPLFLRRRGCERPDRYPENSFRHATSMDTERIRRRRALAIARMHRPSAPCSAALRA